eukprot:10225498-Alexandrium_andersonii.AAC.1
MAGPEQDVLVAGDFNADLRGGEEVAAPVAAICANAGLARVLSAPHAAARCRWAGAGAVGPLRHIDFVLGRGGMFAGVDG